MKNKLKIYSILFILFAISIQCDPSDFGYRRSLTLNTDTWQDIVIPDEMYGRLNDQLTDLRIYGFNGNDTIEAPYLLNLNKDKTETVDVSFKLLNKSFNQNGYFYTFDVAEVKTINRIILNFAKNNFDWRVNLQGSMDLQEWFTIKEDTRIVSIKNSYTDFSFTTLRFDDSQYRYFRIFVNSSIDPEFKSAVISEEKLVRQNERSLNSRFSFSTNRQKKNTTVLIKLKEAVPVSSLKLFFADTLDFYRQIYIEYLSDSIKTEKGYIDYYKPLLNSYISSVDNNTFRFGDVITNQFKIIIKNNDNEPVTLSKAELSGKTYSLVVRYTKDADYQLYYGYKYASKPDYDIERFEENIPDQLTNVSLGEEELLIAGVPQSSGNKIWLWVVMVVVIITLGGFTVKMIMKESGAE